MNDDSSFRPRETRLCVEPGPEDLDAVAGGFLPAVPAAVNATGALMGAGAAGFGAGTAAGYFANR